MGFALGGTFVSSLAPISEVEKQRCYHSADAGHYKADECKTFWERTTTDPVALYTLGLFAFTAVLAVSTVFLWDATRDAARRQEADTKILQRAYLSVEPAGVGASSDSNKCHPNIAIRNVGSVPARKIRWVIDYTISQDHRLPEQTVDRDRTEGDNVLPPGSVMTQGGPIICVGSNPNEMREEVGLYVYVWGIVIYLDGFGEQTHPILPSI